jgi:hypothetical protein
MEQKRKRRDYRQMRKEQFKRPEPGFSMYEGRTRGKRMKYTYSDDEDIFGSDSTNRRSARNTGTTTPAETGPVTTSSGRQIRAPPRLNAAVDSRSGSVQDEASENEGSTGPTGRPRRAAATNRGANGWTGSEAASSRKARDDSDEESQAEFGDDEYDVEEHVPGESEEEEEFDEDEVMADDDLDVTSSSLIVKLSVAPSKLGDAVQPNDQASSTGGQNPAEAAASGSVNSAGEVNGVTAATPEQTINGSKQADPTSAAKVGSPPRQSAEATAETSLAFRGSPEKSAA